MVPAMRKIEFSNRKLIGLGRRLGAACDIVVRQSEKVVGYLGIDYDKLLFCQDNGNFGSGVLKRRG